MDRTEVPWSGVVDLRPERAPIDWELAERRYRDEGWTIVEIARAANYTAHHVRRGLLARGVEMRKSEARAIEFRLLRLIWREMQKRARKGQLGEPIPIDPAWREFEPFRDHALAIGHRPGTSLVRLNPERGFEPGNVAFVPRGEAVRYRDDVGPPRSSRLLEAFGETKGLVAWSKDPRCRVKATTLCDRLKAGMTAEEAIATPPAVNRRAGIGHIPRAERQPRRADVDWERARRLYEQGWTLKQVAAAVGTTRGGVRHAFQRLGVPMRPPSTRTLTEEGRLLNRVWYAMHMRCTDPDDRLYPYHGARGVRVCREWETFPPFHDWALRNGWRKGTALIRIDDGRGYTPSNCRFATKREASSLIASPSVPPKARLLITAFGESKGLEAWARDPRCVVTAPTLRKRLERMSPEQALTLPPLGAGRGDGTRYLTAFGETKTLADWSRDPRCKVSRTGLRVRLAQGMLVKQALSTPAWRTTKRRR